jgi:ribosomal protein S18 acetylase RimI-like enzyme
LHREINSFDGAAIEPPQGRRIQKGLALNPADMEIRRMAPADAVLYRDIRLESLQRNPEAFASTFEHEESQPLTWFADRLAAADVLGAFDDSTVLGTAALSIHQGPKHAHKGVLWGMYVRPNARRAGLGRRLVEGIIELARSRVELIQLTVVQENVQAQRLYANLGFVGYGIEKNALKQNGRYYDEILMAKALTSDTTGR